ncbi:MAG: chaperone NapD [Candidatus Thiosymbion ectosymbiont of Robbea hypermnestra]|nr:chaperone NapD [Candidatus Thiosymbion ectosymbiont of Robbea hypermnestra]
MNICSLVVQTRPDKARAVERRLLALPGVEVHGGRAEGKLVVTVEDVGQGEVADTLASIDRLEGVIGTVLIYHYGGEDSALEESDRESHAA